MNHPNHGWPWLIIETTVVTWDPPWLTVTRLWDPAAAQDASRYIAGACHCARFSGGNTGHVARPEQWTTMNYNILYIHAHTHDHICIRLFYNYIHIFIYCCIRTFGIQNKLHNLYALHCVALSFLALHSITLHYISLDCVILHSTTLHCI